LEEAKSVQATSKEEQIIQAAGPGKKQPAITAGLVMSNRMIKESIYD